MARKLCAGTGQPAVRGIGRFDVYPHCSVCGKELAAQGRKAQRRYANAWREAPRHYAEKEQR